MSQTLSKPSIEIGPPQMVPQPQDMPFLVDDSMVAARNWICCRKVHYWRNEPDPNGVVKPVYVICDKRLGHNGVHRGRYSGVTVIFRDLTPAQVRAVAERSKRLQDRMLQEQQHPLVIMSPDPEPIAASNPEQEIKP